jgi:hypothetical protein
MLKDAGTDRFTVPKMLRELDADQIDNFTRIYQRHAAVVTRHVDEIQFLERFLFHRKLSVALEESLVPQLPWPSERLEELTGPPLPAADDLATVKAIEETTPFATTRSLAALARLRLDDLDAYEHARASFQTAEPVLRAEAALVLTGWRVLCTIGRPHRSLDDIAEELERSHFRLEAAVRLALLGRPNADLLREALGATDPETAFAAALATGDVDRLRAALTGGDLERRAAGNRLIELGIIKPVQEVIEKSPVEVQRELVESVLRRGEPVPELGETLLGIVETTDDETLRERAARILCNQLRPAWALRIARAAHGERYIFQSLLSEAAALPSEAVASVVDEMITAGLFAMHQYGLKEAGTRGAVPDTFVPARFAGADRAMQTELLGLAEAQLEARGDEALHRFVWGVVFGPHPVELRSAAWWVLHRGYLRLEPRGEGPLRLERASIERFFGSMAAFLPQLTSALRDRTMFEEVALRELMTHLLCTAEPAGMTAFFAEERATHELVRAILEALRGGHGEYMVDGMLRFLTVVGTHDRWRDEVIAGLERLDLKGGYYWEKALQTLRSFVAKDLEI